MTPYGSRTRATSSPASCCRSGRCAWSACRSTTQGSTCAPASRQRPDAALAVVTTTHQFPLGTTLPVDRRLALLDWADRRQAWIVEDDYDCEFHHRGVPPPALKSLDRGGRVIYVGSFSKVLFPGLRLGYLVVPRCAVRALRAGRQGGASEPGADDPADGRRLHDRRPFRAPSEPDARALHRAAQGAGGGADRDTFPNELDITLTDGGMHFVARLKGSLRDTDVAARLRGTGHRAVAAVALRGQSTAHNGLIIGYTNVAEGRRRRGGRAHAGGDAGVTHDHHASAIGPTARLDHHSVLGADRPALLRACNRWCGTVRPISPTRPSWCSTRPTRASTDELRSGGAAWSSPAPRSISASRERAIWGARWRAASSCRCCTTMPRCCPAGWKRWSRPPTRIRKPGRSAARCSTPMGACKTSARSCGATRKRPRRWPGRSLRSSASDPIAAADYCGTASLLVRASAWDAIGGADEQIYPAYYVDVDLCTSLWQAGAAVLCQPKSRVHHRRSASTRSLFRDFIVLRNRARLQAEMGRRASNSRSRSTTIRRPRSRAPSRARSRRGSDAAPADLCRRAARACSIPRASGTSSTPRRKRFKRPMRSISEPGRGASRPTGRPAAMGDVARAREAGADAGPESWRGDQTLQQAQRPCAAEAVGRG